MVFRILLLLAIFTSTQLVDTRAVQESQQTKHVGQPQAAAVAPPEGDPDSAEDPPEFDNLLNLPGAQYDQEEPIDYSAPEREPEMLDQPQVAAPAEAVQQSAPSKLSALRPAEQLEDMALPVSQGVGPDEDQWALKSDPAIKKPEHSKDPALARAYQSQALLPQKLAQIREQLVSPAKVATKLAQVAEERSTWLSLVAWASYVVNISVLGVGVIGCLITWKMCSQRRSEIRKSGKDLYEPAFNAMQREKDTYFGATWRTPFVSAH